MSDMEFFVGTFEKAFVEVTDQEPEYCFSGWGAELTEDEKAVL